MGGQPRPRDGEMYDRLMAHLDTIRNEHPETSREWLNGYLVATGEAAWVSGEANARRATVGPVSPELFLDDAKLVRIFRDTAREHLASRTRSTEWEDFTAGKLESLLREAERLGVLAVRDALAAAPRLPDGWWIDREECVYDFHRPGWEVIAIRVKLMVDRGARLYSVVGEGPTHREAIIAAIAKCADEGGVTDEASV